MSLTLGRRTLGRFMFVVAVSAGLLALSRFPVALGGGLTLAAILIALLTCVRTRRCWPVVAFFWFYPMLVHLAFAVGISVIPYWQLRAWSASGESTALLDAASSAWAGVEIVLIGLGVGVLPLAYLVAVWYSLGLDDRWASDPLNRRHYFGTVANWVAALTPIWWAVIFVFVAADPFGAASRVFG